MDHDQVVHLYGPWASRTPQDVRELLAGYRGRWWIAGGWAIQAFTGVNRAHGDIDPSVPRSDAALLRRHLLGAFHVWAADDGALRPLTRDDDAIPPTCSNLWLRRDGAGPWEYDVLLADVADQQWTYKGDARITRSLGDILWTRDGIDYLRPELQLLYKAPRRRGIDQVDFDACAPLLGEAARSWLRWALETAHPGHPWIEALA
jgi:hypothetical protein